MRRSFSAGEYFGMFAIGSHLNFFEVGYCAVETMVHSAARALTGSVFVPRFAAAFYGRSAVRSNWHPSEHAMRFASAYTEALRDWSCCVCASHRAVRELHVSRSG